MLGEVNIDPYGTVYRVLTAKLKCPKSPQLTCLIYLVDIEAHVFPAICTMECNLISKPKSEPIPRIKMDKLSEACKMIGDNKALRPDGIANKTEKVAI